MSHRRLRLQALWSRRDMIDIEIREHHAVLKSKTFRGAFVAASPRRCQPGRRPKVLPEAKTVCPTSHQGPRT